MCFDLTPAVCQPTSLTLDSLGLLLLFCYLVGWLVVGWLVGWLLFVVVVVDCCCCCGGGGGGGGGVCVFGGSF